MALIHKLDKATIDLIAAGEVIERPSSVVKELVENAIDAGASAITVEIREGGISFIRVTDDGCGMAEEDAHIAFESHATSKISAIDDLFSIRSLGFRGEALSSIAAVAKVEMTTKTKEALAGIHLQVTGGEESECKEVGAPDGTTIVVRDLFFNTPARKKFLKRPQTESSYIGDLMERMALSNPDIAFHLIRDKKDKLVTNGSGDYRELIRRIYGKEIAANVHPVFKEQDGYSVAGYLGEPSLNRSNRNFELFFVNGRTVKDKLLSRALEEGYDEYLMQHRFPFAVLMLDVPPEAVDVNAHPSKTEVRFHEQTMLYNLVRDTVFQALHAREMIPEEMPKEDRRTERESAVHVPEPFETARRKLPAVDVGDLSNRKNLHPDPENSPVFQHIFGDGDTPRPVTKETEEENIPSPIIKRDAQVFVERDVQMNLFDVKMLTPEHRDEYRILGQVFGTYWILAFRDKMYMVDQHAAHEKVNYERMMARYHAHDMMSQLLQPPLIVTLTEQEEALFKAFEQSFKDLGFSAEPFGDRTYALRAVPVELYGAEEKELFLSILDELQAERNGMRDPSLFTQRIATMACKASVKGNTEMTVAEMEALIDELLTLDNPYNCPHGRPTIISMSKYEIDKKFKRIV